MGKSSLETRDHVELPRSAIARLMKARVAAFSVHTAAVVCAARPDRGSHLPHVDESRLAR